MILTKFFFMKLIITASWRRSFRFITFNLTLKLLPIVMILSQILNTFFQLNSQTLLRISCGLRRILEHLSTLIFQHNRCCLSFSIQTWIGLSTGIDTRFFFRNRQRLRLSLFNIPDLDCFTIRCYSFPFFSIVYIFRNISNFNLCGFVINFWFYLVNLNSFRICFWWISLCLRMLHFRSLK